MHFVRAVFLMATVLLIFSDTQVFARIYQTSDADIIEANVPVATKRQGRAGKSRSINRQMYYEKPFQSFQRYPPYMPMMTSVPFMPAYHQFGAPSSYYQPNPFAFGGYFPPQGDPYHYYPPPRPLDDSCWTSDSRNGQCGPVRSCTNVKFRLLGSLKQADPWARDPRNGCYYSTQYGRQKYGICCPKENDYEDLYQQFPPPAISMISWMENHVDGVQLHLPQTADSPATQPSTSIAVPSTTSTTSTTTPTTPSATTTTSTTIPPLTTVTEQLTTVTEIDAVDLVATTDSSEEESDSSIPMVFDFLDNPRCGDGPYETKRVIELQRIVGGADAFRNSWPFLVSLTVGGEHFCGGSLLDSQHVLTAAHCVGILSSEHLPALDIVLGLHSMSTDKLDQVILKKVKRVVRHRDYNRTTFYNDVAILKLDSPVEYSKTISPICLPSLNSNETFVGNEGVIVGWGLQKEDGNKQSPVLQQTSVTIQTNEECAVHYGADAPGGITDEMLCAAAPGRDSCTGDSGGPLVVQAARGAPWVQVGVISWGVGCAQPKFPGVYLRTTSYIPWIRKYLEWPDTEDLDRRQSHAQ